MILLDTDQVSLLQHAEGSRYDRRIERIDQLPAGESFAISVITIEEQMRGWMAVLSREQTVRRQVGPYQALVSLFDFFSRYSVAAFDDAAVKYDDLRKAKVRIGTMDLKIASIALVNQAVLVTSNRRDFEQVPGLRAENWAD